MLKRARARIKSAFESNLNSFMNDVGGVIKTFDLVPFERVPAIREDDVGKWLSITWRSDHSVVQSVEIAPATVLGEPIRASERAARAIRWDPKQLPPSPVWEELTHEYSGSDAPSTAGGAPTSTAKHLPALVVPTATVPLPISIL